MKKEKTTKFTSSAEALQSLIKKGEQKKFKLEAKKQYEQLKFQQQVAKRPVSAQLQQMQFQQQQAGQRRRVIGSFASRAEQLEIQAVSLDEVPMLHSMERERTRMTTPPDRSMRRIEKDVTDSFPD